MPAKRAWHWPIADDNDHPIAILTQADHLAHRGPQVLAQAAEITKLTIRGEL